MNIFEAIEKRRSVRKFNNTNIPEHTIRKCLRASVLAANSSNLQPWEFYWIRDANKKERIVKACFSQNAARTAKEIVIAVSRIDTWKRNSKLIIENYTSVKIAAAYNKIYQYLRKEIESYKSEFN